LFDRPIPSAEYQEHLNGRCNKLIVEYLLNGNYTDEDVTRAELLKEERYRVLCRETPGFIRLTNGAETLFDTLKARGIPMAIATASEISNVEFYWKEFDLARWFTFDRIIYSDGKLPMKPAPDIYLEAAKRLGLSPAEVLVFEDSHAGLQAARNAKVGRLYAITGEESGAFGRELADKTIPDFTYFDIDKE
jgi:HAD superfamily hydrolase (TIGR01509 family)